MIKEALTKLIVQLDKAGYNADPELGKKPDFKTIIIREKLYDALLDELGIKTENRPRSFKFGFVTVALGK